MASISGPSSHASSSNSQGSSGVDGVIHQFKNAAKLILQTKNNVQLYPLFSKSIAGTSQTPESSTAPPPKKTLFTLSRFKPTPSSSNSAPPLNRTITPQELTQEKIENLSVIVLDLKGLKESVETEIDLSINSEDKDKFTELSKYLNAKIDKKEAQIAATKQEFIENTEPKFQGIKELLNNLSPTEVSNLGLTTLKEDMNRMNDTSDDKFVLRKGLLEQFDYILKNSAKFPLLANTFVSKSQEADSPFYLKEIPTGTGKVIELGIKDSKGTQYGFFVFKPTDESLGAPKYKSKIDLHNLDQAQIIVKNTVNEVINNAKKFEIGGKIFDLILIINTANITKFNAADFEKFKTAVKLTDEALTDNQINRMWNIGAKSVLAYEDDTTKDFTLNLTQENPKIPVYGMGLQLCALETEEHNYKIEMDADKINKLFGGPKAVAANHIVRASLTELGGQHPISILHKLPSGEEGILMEYCHTVGLRSLEGVLLEDKGESEAASSSTSSAVISLLNESTKEVQDTICNQFLLDILFGETDCNAGNCLITSQKPDGQLSGIVLIDMSLCMPIAAKTAKESRTDLLPPFYQGCEFLNPENTFLLERIKYIDTILPNLISSIKERYKNAGSPLSQIQLNLMMARWEMLKLLRDQGNKPESMFSANTLFFIEAIEKNPKIDFTKEKHIPLLRKYLVDEWNKDEIKRRSEEKRLMLKLPT